MDTESESMLALFIVYILSQSLQLVLGEKKGKMVGLTETF